MDNLVFLLLAIALLGSISGLFYPAVVAVALFVTRRRKNYRPRATQIVSLAFPPLTYYFLEFAVERRQDWNIALAVPTLTLFVVIGIVIACVLRRPVALWVTSALAIPVAVALWRAIPHSSLRMF